MKSSIRSKYFSLGTRIRVVVNSVDISTRAVDFVIADDFSALDEDIY